MIIKGYGLFWQQEEVDWNPGKGRQFRLLGRVGTNRPGIRIADFRHQQGIYILYSNHGPYYVGLTKKQGLGKRLRDHLEDHHAGKWERFSWFGFQSTKVGADGVYGVEELEVETMVDPHSVISDVEALLIHAIGPRNTNQMKFAEAEEWTQIKSHEIERFMDKVSA